MNEKIVDDIAHVRALNNILWMDLLKLALKADPKEAKRILGRIRQNDLLVSELTGKLSES